MTGNENERGFILQARDRLLLNEIARMRLIDREMAKLVGGFRSTTRANTRLLQLTRAGLLRRFFVGTISAGRKAIYSLAPGAASFVDSPIRPFHQLRRGGRVASELHVTHQMALNDLYLDFTRRAKPPAVEKL